MLEQLVMPRAFTENFVSKLHELKAIFFALFIKIYYIPLPRVFRWGYYVLRDSLDLTVDLLHKL